MKTLVIFACIIALAVTQRPSFAGTSAKVYPQLASRFQDTSANSEPSSASNNLANRVGESPKTTTATQTLDVNVANRFNQQPQAPKHYRPTPINTAGIRKPYASY